MKFLKVLVFSSFALCLMSQWLFCSEAAQITVPAKQITATEFFSGSKYVRDIWTHIEQFLPPLDSGARFLARYRPISNERADTLADRVDVMLMAYLETNVLSNWIQCMQLLLADKKIRLAWSKRIIAHANANAAPITENNADMTARVLDEALNLSMSDYLAKLTNLKSRYLFNGVKTCVGLLSHLNLADNCNLFIPYKRVGIHVGESYLKIRIRLQVKLDEALRARGDLQRAVFSARVSNGEEKKAFLRAYLARMIDTQLQRINCSDSFTTVFKKYAQERQAHTDPVSSGLVIQPDTTLDQLISELQTIAHNNPERVRKLCMFLLKLKILVLHYDNLIRGQVRDFELADAAIGVGGSLAGFSQIFVLILATYLRVLESASGDRCYLHSWITCDRCLFK